MLDRAKLFVELAACGSFTALANRTGLSAVTCARRIERLEEELGYPVCLRGKTGITFTSKGNQFLQLIAPVVRNMDDVMLTAQRLSDIPDSVPVRISGTEPVIAELVAPRLTSLLEIAPDLCIELIVDNKPVNLSKYEAEIALRFAKPEENSLLQRKLTAFKMSVWKNVACEESFRNARLVGYNRAFGSITERRILERPDFLERTHVQSSSTRAILNIVRANGAMGILPDYLGKKYSELTPVDDAPAVPDRPLWMLMNRDVAKQRNVRTVADWLAGQFKGLSQGTHTR